ncbi:uncharacterized protein LOC125318439 isoform X2 [Corvus hawaiiensis]|uniref:uncharacterized protein LOC125318439 isoform X2 n=1 Tax=Corvus hawaiiensis TaxID=134902 RepID=UPI002018F83A|nr:uncharacterized protein LOC125318439 isoform X2 [Corvus hawaiiensis]
MESGIPDRFPKCEDVHIFSVYRQYRKESKPGQLQHWIALKPSMGTPSPLRSGLPSTPGRDFPSPPPPTRPWQQKLASLCP